MNSNIFIIVAIVFLFYTLIIDRYSTRKLLNYYMALDNKPKLKQKFLDYEVKEKSIKMEKNLILRKLIKKYGLKRGMWYMDVFIAAPLTGLLIGFLVSVDSMNDIFPTMCLLIFMAGFISNQFVRSIFLKRKFRKIGIDIDNLEAK